MKGVSWWCAFFSTILTLSLFFIAFVLLYLTITNGDLALLLVLCIIGLIALIFLFYYAWTEFYNHCKKYWANK